LYQLKKQFNIMNRKDIFDRSIAVLVKAYQDNTLQAVNCYACAVGNLVAAQAGVKYIQHPDVEDEYFKWDTKIEPDWFDAMCATRDGGDWLDKEQFTRGCVQIATTGYTMKEVILIEDAFENTYSSYSKHDGHDPMFEAMMGVYKVLCEIHEIDKPSKGEEVFVKPTEKVVACNV